MNSDIYYYFTYFVIFKSGSLNTDGPILRYPAGEKILPNHGGTMHLFDPELDGTPDAVEFLMHMPRNIFDLYDLDEYQMDASYDTPHYITPLPDLALARVRFSPRPTMFILTDDCDAAAKRTCESQAPLLGVFYIHELNEALLKRLWAELWDRCKTDRCSVVPDIAVQHILRGRQLLALPALFTSRQFRETDEFLAKIYNSPQVEYDCIDAQWMYTARLNALISLGDQGIEQLSSLTASRYRDEVEKAAAQARLSVVITLPGVAKRSKKMGMSSGVLTEQERRIIRIMGVHRAVARRGALIELPCLEDSVYQTYSELEQRCKKTNNSYVWRALNKLGRQIGRYFSPQQIALLKRAKDITVFSDFPVGLAILEGDEVPLQCYKSISYRPLTPLTRNYQRELSRTNQKYLGERCKVAFAECIPNNEENRFVYPMSEEVYHTLVRQHQEYPNLSVTYRKIGGVRDMETFIAANRDADILYISAHGSYSEDSNAAGLVIGDDVWMADKDFFSPPIVILSACHSSPRGAGPVAIADMFLRNGAIAVLGAFIPIHAHRNLILMTRLFTYIAEAQKKYDQYSTLADAWSGIVAGNAIHELTTASPSFRKWMHGTNSRGNIRIVEFQLQRCVNRLRSSHVYSDTIKIVKEMLAEEGMQGRFGNILDQNDYFPESFFYQWIGSPENIFLYNEIFDQYSQEQGASDRPCI